MLVTSKTGWRYNGVYRIDANSALKCLFVYRTVLFHRRIQLIIGNDALYLIIIKKRWFVHNDALNKIHHTKTVRTLLVVRRGPGIALAKKAWLSKFLVTRSARWATDSWNATHHCVYNNNVRNILTYLVGVPNTFDVFSFIRGFLLSVLS